MNGTHGSHEDPALHGDFLFEINTASHLKAKLPFLFLQDDDLFFGCCAQMVNAVDASHGTGCHGNDFDDVQADDNAGSLVNNNDSKHRR